MKFGKQDVNRDKEAFPLLSPVRQKRYHGMTSERRLRKERRKIKEKNTLHTPRLGLGRDTQRGEKPNRQEKCKIPRCCTWLRSLSPANLSLFALSYIHFPLSLACLSLSHTLFPSLLPCSSLSLSFLSLSRLALLSFSPSPALLLFPSLSPLIPFPSRLSTFSLSLSPCAVSPSLFVYVLLMVPPLIH